MIECKSCHVTRDGDPNNGKDCCDHGWKLLVSEDGGFMSFCPKCRAIIEDYGQKLFLMIQSKYVYLYTLLKDKSIEKLVDY